MKITLRNQLPALLKITAILLGIIAQSLIHTYLYISLGLWLAALVLFFFSIRNTPNTFMPKITVNPITHEKISPWGYILGVIAIVFCGLSFFMFSTDLPNIYAWIIHILSLVLILVAVIFLASSRKKRASKEKNWHWVEIALLIAIFLLAIFLRTFKLSTLPYGFWFDEADDGLNALQIFSNPMNIPVFADSTRLPAHLIYLIAFSIKLLGQSIFSVRIVSVLFGVGTTAAAFLVGRELFGSRRIGMLLAFLLAVARWDLVWSRIGMHGVTVPFFELLSVGLMLRAFRLQRYRDYLFAGLSLGLGLCFYVPFRLFPLVMLILIGLISITQKEYFKKSWRHLLIFVFGVIVISVPISQFAVFHSEEFWGRTGQVSIFSGRTFEDGVKTAIKTTGEHLAMFTYKGDRNGRHNIPSEPMLDLVSGALLIFGVAYCLYRIKQPVSILLLCWLLLMIVPGILSLDFESPQSYRSIGSLPAAYLLSILPIHALFVDQKLIYKRKTSVLIASSLVLIFFSIGALNFYGYFVRQANSSDSWAAHSTQETIIAREMVRYGSQVDYYVGAFYYGTPTIRFLAPAIKDYQQIETYETFPFLLNGQRDVILFLDPERKNLVDQFKKAYPNAVFTEHKSPGGTINLYEIYLSIEEIQSIQGVRVEYFESAEKNEKPFLTNIDDQLNMDWTSANPGSLPFHGEISGTLYAESYGIYKFGLESPSDADFYIDGQLAFHSNGGNFSGSTELAEGVHSIEIKATGSVGKFRLTWQPPGGEMVDIPASNLFLPTISNNGLLGSYYPNANWEGEPEFKKVDPFIQFYFHNTPLPRPYTVEWNGYINIDLAGSYEMGVESIDASQLYIDGNLIVDNQTPNQYQGKLIDLQEGLHSIKIRYSDLTGYTHIKLYWKPPDSDLQYIPSEVLFLP